MKLDYSFGSVPTLWFDGPLPLADLGVQRVKVEMAALSSADGPFPPVFALGDLLPHKRPVPKVQHGVTLMLQYICGYNPPMSESPPFGKFYPTPGEPIIGQIRIALDREAIAAIQESGDADIPFKITLSGVEFHDVTKKG